MVKSVSRLVLLGLGLGLSSCTVPTASLFLPPAPAVTEMLTSASESRDGQSIDLIVLHDTASSATAAQNARWFQDPANQASVHYLIDRDGSILRCVPDELRAWHAGAAEFEGATNINQRSIGIELCNLGDGTEPFPAVQIKSLIRLMGRVSWDWDIPAHRFVRHRDVAVPAGRKADPADNFDAVAVYEAVRFYRETGQVRWGP